MKVIHVGVGDIFEGVYDIGYVGSYVTRDKIKYNTKGG